MCKKKKCYTIPYWNILKTKIKQITNPQKKISGGFLFLILKVIAAKNMKNI